MAAVSKQTIKSELAALDRYITCVDLIGDGGSTADHWLKVFPGISPKELFTRLKATQPDCNPYLTIHLTNDKTEMFIDIGKISGMKVFVTNSSVVLDNIYLPPDSQDQSTAKKTMQWLADFALTMDKPRLTLTAQQANGAYTWARFGFAPIKSEEPGRPSEEKRQDWNHLKKVLREFRLNADHTRISYDNKNDPEPPGGYQSSPFSTLFPKGFALAGDEPDIINRALQSDIPEDLWRISDLGREVARIDRGKDKPPLIVTVGKALLCGLAWDGKLELTPGNKGYDRFLNYINRAPELSVVEARQSV